MGWLEKLLRIDSKAHPFPSGGNLKYLLQREPSREACMIEGVSAEAVDLALDIFCDAFDIEQEQKYSLRPSDKLMDIYSVMVTGQTDDLEFERLGMNLDDIEAGIPGESDPSIETIEDLCRWVYTNCSFPIKWTP